MFIFRRRSCWLLPCLRFTVLTRVAAVGVAQPRILQEGWNSFMWCCNSGQLDMAKFLANYVDTSCVSEVSVERIPSPSLTLKLRYALR